MMGELPKAECDHCNETFGVGGGPNRVVGETELWLCLWCGKLTEVDL